MMAGPVDTLQLETVVPPMSSATLDLFHALSAVDSNEVRKALAAGADVNASDARGRTVVLHAALGDAYVSPLCLHFILITPTGSNSPHHLAPRPISHRSQSTD